MEVHNFMERTKKINEKSEGFNYLSDSSFVNQQYFPLTIIYFYGKTSSNDKISYGKIICKKIYFPHSK